MFILSETPSIANQFMGEMRDITIQHDRMRFRKNMERLGEILAYEISKSLPYKSQQVATPLAKTQILIPESQIVLVSVLRASLPFYQGFLNFFDTAESGFIGAFRDENESGEIKINLGYHASPSLEGKVVILADPMLATGKSIIRTLDTIVSHGTPAMIHIAALFAAPEGIKYIEETMNLPYKLWLGTIDEKLNHLSYIVPGLGDAGDLAFGGKL